jgi:hypothetical protein
MAYLLQLHGDLDLGNILLDELFQRLFVNWLSHATSHGGLGDRLRSEECDLKASNKPGWQWQCNAES